MHSTKTPSTTQHDTLSLMRELAEFVIDDDDEDVHPDDAMAAACRLASLFLELESALRQGAQAPTAWRLA